MGAAQDPLDSVNPGAAGRAAAPAQASGAPTASRAAPMAWTIGRRVARIRCLIAPITRGDSVNNHRAGWARPGWGDALPWGWYSGWSSWGWWTKRPVGWGLAALATGAAIGSLVDDAINAGVTYNEVPDSSYDLDYSSLEQQGRDSVTFSVNTDSGLVQMTADFRAGR